MTRRVTLAVCVMILAGCLASSDAYAAPYGHGHAPGPRPPSPPVQPPSAVQQQIQQQQMLKSASPLKNASRLPPVAATLADDVGSWSDFGSLSDKELAALFKEMGLDIAIGTGFSGDQLVDMMIQQARAEGYPADQIAQLEATLRANTGPLASTLDTLNSSGANDLARAFKQEYARTCMCDDAAFATALSRAETRVIADGQAAILSSMGVPPDVASSMAGNVTVVYGRTDPEIQLASDIVSSGGGGGSVVASSAPPPPSDSGGDKSEGAKPPADPADPGGRKPVVSVVSGDGGGAPNSPPVSGDGKGGNPLPVAKPDGIPDAGAGPADPPAPPAAPPPGSPGNGTSGQNTTGPDIPPPPPDGMADKAPVSPPADDAPAGGLTVRDDRMVVDEKGNVIGKIVPPTLGGGREEKGRWEIIDPVTAMPVREIGDIAQEFTPDQVEELNKLKIKDRKDQLQQFADVRQDFIDDETARANDIENIEAGLEAVKWVGSQTADYLAEYGKGPVKTWGEGLQKAYEFADSYGENLATTGNQKDALIGMVIDTASDKLGGFVGDKITDKVGGSFPLPGGKSEGKGNRDTFEKQVVGFLMDGGGKVGEALGDKKGRVIGKQIGRSLGKDTAEGMKESVSDPIKSFLKDSAKAATGTDGTGEAKGIAGGVSKATSDRFEEASKGFQKIAENPAAAGDEMLSSAAEKVYEAGKDKVSDYVGKLLKGNIAKRISGDDKTPNLAAPTPSQKVPAI